MGWLTIDSAPKDGTIFDVWLGNADHADLYFYCGKDLAIENYRRATNWWWSNGKFRPYMGLDVPTFVQPTHWMPLPQGPK